MLFLVSECGESPWQNCLKLDPKFTKGHVSPGAGRAGVRQGPELPGLGTPDSEGWAGQGSSRARKGRAHTRERRPPEVGPARDPGGRPQAPSQAGVTGLPACPGPRTRAAGDVEEECRRQSPSCVPTGSAASLG